MKTITTFKRHFHKRGVNFVNTTTDNLFNIQMADKMTTDQD